MFTVVAKIGAKVRWHGKGEPVELKPAEIRGVKSDGMICGADEIGLAEMFPKKVEREIIDLQSVSSAKPGLAISKALNLSDVIFEIDHKSLSNRPDLWGHYGVARELAALYKKPFSPYRPPAIQKSRGKLAVTVEDKKLCPRYMAVAVSGIEVAPSPAWMRDRLSSVGIRPINNVVDITNYVMMELGQPMHAFSSEKLGIRNKELRIVVRSAKDGERLRALDGKEYALTKDMLVIADSDKPIAIAGIMGGEGSSVTEKTTVIVFESATFDAVSVRKTSTDLGLRSESSARFEKGLSTDRAELGLRRAVELLLQLCPEARVASAVADKKQVKHPVRTLAFDFGVFEQLLGVAVSFQTVKDILARLGFGVSRYGKNIRVAIPIWRSAKDISIANTSTTSSPSLSKISPFPFGVEVVAAMISVFGSTGICSVFPAEGRDPASGGDFFLGILF
jgi:phenylalanyl-tRNA synthetase beta chain